MEERQDSIGRLTFHCAPCARNKQGFCRDCPGRLERPRALRCDRCARDRRRECQRLVAARHYATPTGRARHLRHKRKSYQKPEVRQKRLAYLRQYRLDHPRVRDELDRAYYRADQRKRRADPVKHAQDLVRRRKRYAARRQAAA